MKLSACCLVTLAVSLSFIAAAGDWPQWRGPDGNGISKETGWTTKWPADGPKRLWTAKVGIGFASFSVSHGRVYTTGNTDDTDTIFCFDANSGKELWKHAYPEKLDPKYYEGGTSATPTVDGDRVYSLSKQGELFCLDASKGTVIWSKNVAKELNAKLPTWGFAGSVCIEGNMALLNVGTAGAALDKKTGKVLWSSGPEEAGYSTPVVFDLRGERCVALAGKQHIYSVRLKDGTVLWRHPWKTQYDVNAADPIVSGTTMVIGSGYGHGCAALDISSTPPKVIWENKNLRTQLSPAALLGGYLYGADDDAYKPEATFRCVDLKTGEVKWSEKTGYVSLLAADGKLIALTARGELLIVEATPEAFKPIARAQVIGGKCWTTPVLANGRIYCRNAAGDVVCLDVSRN
ncbi:MAG: PQQ-binding-like beta-propeller repeat protein [Verrucomicrobia bacterium]|nr:PQQ-binding-like beta-propeller repeat protein [Verrucomicrobiota bacterium]